MTPGATFQPRKPEAPARPGRRHLRRERHRRSGARPNSQIQAMLTARKPGWHGERLQTATRDALVPHQQKSGGIQRP
jgi:hypothetical protein